MIKILGNFFTKTTLNKYILSWLTFGFGAGILIYIYSSYQVLILLVPALVVLLFFLKTQYEIKVLVLGLVFGISRMYVYSEMKAWKNPNLTYGSVCLIGYIESIKNNKYTILLESIKTASDETKSSKINGSLNCNNMRVILSSDVEIPCFSTIVGDADIYPPSKPCAPGGYDPSYKLFFKEVIACGKLNSYQICNVPEKNKLRAFLMKKIANKFDTNEYSIINAILFGQNNLSPEIQCKFKKLGISHVLAISGLHFSLFGGLFYLVGRWIIAPLLLIARSARAPLILIARYIVGSWIISPLLVLRATQTRSIVPMQIIGTIFAVFGLFFYLSIAQTSWSVMRSCIMAFIPIIMIVLGRRITAARSSIIALILILIIWPHAILDSGLQLSFIAVYTLIYAKSNFVGNFISNFWTSTLNVMIVTLPYLLYSFGYASLQPFIASIVCVPFFSFVVMPLLALSSVTLFPSILIYYLGKAVSIFLYIIDVIENLFILDIFYKISGISLIFWSIGLASWVLIRNRGVVLVSLALFLITCAKKELPQILIDYSGHEVAFFENGIIWAKDPTSFHTHVCADMLSARLILPIEKYMKVNDHEYSWKNVHLFFTKSNNRFFKAENNDQQALLTRWDMVCQKSPVAIKVDKNTTYICFNK